MERFFNFIEQNPNFASALAAIIAVVVSFLSILLTFISLLIQRIHNLNSVRPIGNIELSDYENLLEVSIINSGTGPLIIEKFSATDNKGCKEPNLYKLMPRLPDGYYWDTFFENCENFSMIPSKSLSILKLSGKIDDISFCKIRDTMRKRLSEIEVSLSYKDIYGRKMPENKKDMRWFSRHFNGYESKVEKK